jgi:RNA polymerase sigma factor (sigma-70 family)
MFSQDYIREELGPIDNWIPIMKSSASTWSYRNPYLPRDEAISEGFVILWQAYCDFDLEKSSVDKFPMFLKYRINNRLHDFMRKHHCISKPGLIDKKARTRHYITETPSEDGPDMIIESFENESISDILYSDLVGLLEEKLEPKMFRALMASTERAGQKRLAAEMGLTEGMVSHMARTAKQRAKVVLAEAGITGVYGR